MIIGTAAWAIALIVIEHVDRGALVDGVLSPFGWDGTIARPPHRPRAAPAGVLRLSRQDRVARVERAAIAFFGVRAVGSIYYLAYALNNGDFPAAPTLWAVANFVILLSARYTE